MILNPAEHSPKSPARQLKFENLAASRCIGERTTAFCCSSVCTFAAVLRLRHAQPKQRNTVRTPRMYRITAHIAQSHHAGRSTEAEKQNRFPAANARPLQSTPLRGHLGGAGKSESPRFLFFCLTKEHQPSFGTKRTPSLDAHRHRFKGIRLLHAPPLIAQWHNKKTPPFCGFAMRILVLLPRKRTGICPKIFPLSS